MSPSMLEAWRIVHPGVSLRRSVPSQGLLEQAEQEGVEPVPALPELGQLGYLTLQAVQGLGAGA